MKFKKGIDPTHVHPLLWGKLFLADREHIVLTGEEMVITSMRRPHKDGSRSRHSPEPDVYCTGADIRRWRLDQMGRAEHFCKWMQTTLNLGVLLEPDWMTREQIRERGGIDSIAPHIHTQLRIKPDELGFEWVN